MNKETAEKLLNDLAIAADQVSTDEEMRDITSQIAQITRVYRMQNGLGMPKGPAEQAQEVDEKFLVRPHIEYLSERIAEAVRDVERGQSRKIAISMPPRMGKSTLVSQYAPLWMLRRHPDWDFILSSHDSSLTTIWAKRMRAIIENNPKLGIALARDGGAAAAWSTVEDGSVLARSTRSGITGRGAKVFIIDDPIRDFVEAHSANQRQSLWDWWLSVAQTRLEPPSLVLVVMTRWHEDDFIGRLFSDDWEGAPKDWERISIPAIAESDDLIGRSPGEPLYSPLVNESEEKTISRWEDVRTSAGTYTFASMYQQRPAPAKGAVFDSGWWRFWTSDETKQTEDGRVVYLDPSSLTGGTWCDSWDCSFKATDPETGGHVVGQRWVRNQGNRYMVSQQRGRWSFTQTIEAMTKWAKTDSRFESPYGNLVHTRLIEDAANGSAIMDVLKDKISGIKPILATVGKVSRARAVTPEIESGNVFLPHPSDPGNEWVADLLSEFRNFPYDAHDDQVDSMTQALAYLRDSGQGSVAVPGRVGGPQWGRPRNVASAALSDITRRRY